MWEAILRVMKMTEHELRQIIREEFMRGVPEFVLRQIASNCAKDVKQQVERFIQQRAETSSRAKQMRNKANESLYELETKIYELIETQLVEFIQQA